MLKSKNEEICSWAWRTFSPCLSLSVTYSLARKQRVKCVGHFALMLSMWPELPTCSLKIHPTIDYIQNMGTWEAICNILQYLLTHGKSDLGWHSDTVDCGVISNWRLMNDLVAFHFHWSSKNNCPAWAASARLNRPLKVQIIPLQHLITDLRGSPPPPWF